MATPVGVTFHVSWSTVMSTALSSMFFIIISSFLVVSPLKFCVTAVKLAASLCCPIRQLVTRARATHPRLSRGRPYRTCLPPGKSSADAKDETLTKSAKSNPTSPRDGWYRAPIVVGKIRKGKEFFIPIQDVVGESSRHGRGGSFPWCTTERGSPTIS